VSETLILEFIVDFSTCTGMFRYGNISGQWSVYPSAHFTCWPTCFFYLVERISQDI